MCSCLFYDGGWQLEEIRSTRNRQKVCQRIPKRSRYRVAWLDLASPCHQTWRASVRLASQLPSVVICVTQCLCLVVVLLWVQTYGGV